MATVETPARVGLVRDITSRSLGIGDWQHLVRGTLATTVAYVFAELISPGINTIFAPLTAMLVMQSSAFATVGMTIQRVVGTTVGVIAASIFVNVFGGSLLVFGLGVLLAFVLARLMPLGTSARTQVMISMLFVLSLGPGEWVTDLWRVVDTLVGGTVALAAIFVAPPKPDLAPARTAFAKWYEEVAGHLEGMAHELSRAVSVSRGERHGFVAQSFRLRELDVDSRAAFIEAVESVQFNPRAHSQVADQLDLLERDLRWITSVTVQVRALSGEVDRLYDREGGLPPVLPRPMLAALLLGLAQLMRAEVYVGAKRTTVDRRGRRVQGLLSEAMAMVTGGPHDMGEVLQSLTLLGRVDSLARTIHGGPARLATLLWDDRGGEPAPGPLGPPTGLVPAVNPEDDPTMTMSLDAIRAHRVDED